MEVLQDNLCLILDLEGFFTHGKFFHVREMGYHTWNQEHGRHAVFILIPYKALNDKDRNTYVLIRFAQTNVKYLPLK